MIIRNFLFHRIHPMNDPLWNPIKPAFFEKIIQHINNKYAIIQLEDIPHIQDKSKKYASISFDDGYADNFEFAKPILNKYNIKASFYIVTDSIDYNTPPWTYELDYLLAQTKIDELILDLEFIPEKLRKNKFNTSNEKLKFAKTLKPLAKKLKNNNRLNLMKALREVIHDVSIPSLMMNWEQVRVLQQEGHIIGSHGKTHSMLGKIDDENELINELKFSADRIKSETGIQPLSISYPIGSFNSKVKFLSVQNNYKFGLAVKQTTYNTETDDLFEIPRIEIYNESWIKTKLRISNTLEKIKKISGYK